MRIYPFDPIKLPRPNLGGFDSLSASKRNEICSHIEEQEFAPGDIIVRAGSMMDDVYIVAEGSVEVVRNQAKDKNPVLKKNNIFGENVSLGFSATRNATVRALEHTRLFVLKGHFLKRLYEEIPSVKFEMTELASKREASQVH